jgi:ISXO2-like transposase domain
VAKGTVLHADEAPSWNDLHARYEVKRIDHQLAYSLDGACTNQVESYFSRLRRGEMGTTTTSPAGICFATPRKARGARTTAVSPTATKCGA